MAPKPIEVELRRSGRIIVVPVEQTVLEALENAGVNVASLCRAGICGTCETRVLDADSPTPRWARLCVLTAGRLTRLTLDI